MDPRSRPAAATERDLNMHVCAAHHGRLPFWADKPNKPMTLAVTPTQVGQEQRGVCMEVGEDLEEEVQVTLAEVECTWEEVRAWEEVAMGRWWGGREPEFPAGLDEEGDGHGGGGWEEGRGDPCK